MNYDKNNIILKTVGLTKHYGGVKALEDANFSMFKNEHIAIVGDNGAGKSTFVRSITGVEKPTSGKIFFNGKKVNFKSPTDARVSGIETVYQNLALADDLDVTANIFLGREIEFFRLGPLSWLNKRAMKKKSIDLLAQTGIKIGNLNQTVASMSGGQRQCVAISRAAGWGSKLIVMDEPTAALGIQETKKVEQIIKNLKERNIPVLIISHNLRQVFNLVDKIAVFRQGRIIDIVKTNEVSGNDIVALITGLDKKNKEIKEYI